MKPFSVPVCHAARRMLMGSLIATSLPVSGHDWCVSTADDFRAKLLLAQSNAESDSIRLVRGTYLNAGNIFTFASTEVFALDVSGGYNADCTTQIPNPQLTVLNGGGLSQVLQIDTLGPVSLRFLRITNGINSFNGDGGGFRISGSGPNSQATIQNNIVDGNLAGMFFGGGVIEVDGVIRVEGNLILQNSGPRWGALKLSGGATSNIYLTNNTFVNNVQLGVFGYVIYIYSAASASPNVFAANNTFWGNLANTPLDYASQHTRLNNNDLVVVGTPAAGSANNFSANPMYAGPSLEPMDAHVLPTSPLVGAGSLTPQGGLPDIDLDGNPRSYAGLVDVGAYQRGDLIFRDGSDL